MLTLALPAHNHNNYIFTIATHCTGHITHSTIRYTSEFCKVLWEGPSVNPCGNDGIQGTITDYSNTVSMAEGRRFVMKAKVSPSRRQSAPSTSSAWSSLALEISIRMDLNLSNIRQHYLDVLVSRVLGGGDQPEADLCRARVRQSKGRPARIIQYGHVQ